MGLADLPRVEGGQDSTLNIRKVQNCLFSFTPCRMGPISSLETSVSPYGKWGQQSRLVRWHLQDTASKNHSHTDHFLC